MLTQKSASTQPRTDLPKFALPTLYPPPAARRERSSGSASAVGRIASLAPEGRRGLQRSICPPFPSLTERYQLSDNFGSFSAPSVPICSKQHLTKLFAEIYTMQRSALCRSRRELSNAYLLAEPRTSPVKFAKPCNLRTGAPRRVGGLARRDRGAELAGEGARRRSVFQRPPASGLPAAHHLGSGLKVWNPGAAEV